MSDLFKNISLFQPISLLEMDGVALMKRVDTKFVIHKDKLGTILKALTDNYQMLEIKGARLMSYVSSYFDTPTHNFFYDHHNGRKVRAKVRVREYVDSRLQFIEVKQKTNKEQTIKTRIETVSAHNLQATNTFAQKLLGKTEPLHQTVTNDFKRLTLVNITAQERITIDTDIRFNQNFWNKNLAIIELKQQKLRRSSPLFQILKKHQIHPAKVSKYCLGMSMAYPQLKINNFKPVFRNILKNITQTS